MFGWTRRRTYKEEKKEKEKMKVKTMQTQVGALTLGMEKQNKQNLPSILSRAQRENKTERKTEKKNQPTNRPRTKARID